ncbi:hypothetical protein [Nocardioides okcheonensis]|uniref:hypothetical protein n=1 Tax=Nocardioides okcheonensis TaxID=2894081 RepID=UPI001E35BCC5|nr:hypothetical protein [Nocardioides okcheonensis]UFN45437.1 hypothetical protein LN652_04300 [Nocardioides okcheonensis]
MSGLFVTALALGTAGIDPAGVLLALGSLAAGARERTVLVFTAIVVAGTALLGTILTMTLGQQLQDFDWTSVLPPDWLGAAIEAVLAGALLAWAVARLRRRDVRPPRPARPGRTGSALVAGGLVFAASAPLDPTFVGLVVLAGRSESVPEIALAHVTWIVTSQLPLIALAFAIMLRRHGRAVAWLRDLMPRARPVLARVGTATLVLAGLVMAADAAWWLVTGHFLLPDPT